MNSINFSAKGKDFTLSLEDFFGHQLCITHNGEQIGFLGFEVRKGGAFIEMVEVDEEFRRMGLSKRLYSALLKFCKSSDLKWISGSAVNPRIPGIRAKLLGNIHVKSNGNLCKITSEAAVKIINERKLLMLYSLV